MIYFLNCFELYVKVGRGVAAVRKGTLERNGLRGGWRGCMTFWKISYVFKRE